MSRFKIRVFEKAQPLDQGWKLSSILQGYWPVTIQPYYLLNQILRHDFPQFHTDLRCSHIVLAMVYAWSNTVQVARPSSISIETPQYCSTVRPYLGVDPDLHSNLGVLRSAACGVRDTLVRQRLQPRSPLPFVVLLYSTPYPVFPSQKEASGPHIL